MSIPPVFKGYIYQIDPKTNTVIGKFSGSGDVIRTYPEYKSVGYDYMFVANMCKADYYGSSIEDEKHFALYIKDTIDDEDAADGTTMRRWYATMVANGVMVDWEEFV